MASDAHTGIRSVAVLGHSHAGKTSLCEALLHRAGVTPRLGSVDQRTSILDTEPEEHQHAMTIVTGVAHAMWGRTRLVFLDCPGFQDFESEVIQALAAADAVLLVVAADGSVPVGAEAAWRVMRDRGLPGIIVVNKMDRDNAAFEQAVDALRATFGRAAIAVAVPVGAGDNFRGFVDLVDDHARGFHEGGQTEAAEVPEAMAEEVTRAHTALVDAVAETDDDLLERYLGGAELSDDEIRTALHAAALRGVLVPIVCAAATVEKGAELVLDSIVRYLPGPDERVHEGVTADGEPLAIEPDPDGPLCAQVFKTAIDTFGRVSYFRVLRGTIRSDTHPFDPRSGADERFAQLARPVGRTLVAVDALGPGDIGAVTKMNNVRTGDVLCTRGAVVALPALTPPPAVYTAAVGARVKGDEDKVVAALGRLCDEDLGLHLSRDPVTQEMLIHGLGDVHVNVALERARRKYGTDAEARPPMVPYRETISRGARAQHRHRKQSGGAGLYGDCTIEIEPLARGGGFVWEDRIVGGAIPQQFRPSVEKGVRQTVEQGGSSGFPIVDVRVRLVDGSTHPVDGKDIAFQIAGSMAMRDAVRQAGPILLEPVMRVVVTAPERFTGDIVGLLTSRRGRVAGMAPSGEGSTDISADVPQAETFSLPIDLRAATQGRARHRTSFLGYEEVPDSIAKTIISAHSREHAAASA